MEVKAFEMFYFDDQSFIALCRQLEKEIKAIHDWSGENLMELRLAYEKFEIFLAVYFRSKRREEIDYKLEQREIIAVDLNLLGEADSENVTQEFRKEKFHDAKEKLLRVIEDILYQIRIVAVGG